MLSNLNQPSNLSFGKELKDKVPEAISLCLPNNAFLSFRSKSCINLATFNLSSSAAFYLTLREHCIIKFLFPVFLFMLFVVLIRIMVCNIL